MFAVHRFALSRSGCIGLAFAVSCGRTQSADGVDRAVVERAESTATRVVALSPFRRRVYAYGDLRREFAAVVARAEAEGARHPRAGTKTWSVPRRCVDATAPAPDVYGMGRFRSGEFTAGPFAMYAETWRQGSGKLWWIPQDVDTSAMFLLRAEPLDHTGVAYELRRHGLVRQTGPGGVSYFLRDRTAAASAGCVADHCVGREQLGLLSLRVRVTRSRSATL
jgi:hypothetical protein